MMVIQIMRQKCPKLRDVIYGRPRNTILQILQTVKVRSMTNVDCVKSFYKGFPLTERMLCAWKRNSTGFTIGDTCGGDSGGKVTLPRPFLVPCPFCFILENRD